MQPVPQSPHPRPFLGVARKAFGKKPRSETIGVNKTGSLVWKQAPAETTQVEHLSQAADWVLSHHSSQASMGRFIPGPPKLKNVALQVTREID